VSNNPCLQCDSQLESLAGFGCEPTGIGKTNTGVRAALEAVPGLPGACEPCVDLPSLEKRGATPFDLAEAGAFHTRSGALRTAAASRIALSLAVVSTCLVLLPRFPPVAGARQRLLSLWLSPGNVLGHG